MLVRLIAHARTDDVLPRGRSLTPAPTTLVGLIAHARTDDAGPAARSRSAAARLSRVHAVALDPRTPVLVGCGQFLNHAATLADALEPADLMARAIESAAADAGLASVPEPDSVRVVSLLTWKYGNPALIVAQRLGLSPRETAVTTNGGN